VFGEVLEPLGRDGVLDRRCCHSLISAVTFSVIRLIVSLLTEAP